MFAVQYRLGRFSSWSTLCDHNGSVVALDGSSVSRALADSYFLHCYLGVPSGSSIPFVSVTSESASACGFNGVSFRR